MLKKLFILFLIVGLTAVCAALDWKEIKASGRLVVLTELQENEGVAGGLHRIVSPPDIELAILGKFAKANGLKLDVIRVKEFSQLFTELEAGKADLVSSMITDTPDRRARFLMSLPITESREYFITASNSKIKGNTIDSLKKFKGWIIPKTSYQYYMEKNNLGLNCFVLKKAVSNDELIEMVAKGRIEYSIMDEGYIDSWMAYNSGIRKVCKLPRTGNHVFIAQKSSPELIRHLNEFMKKIDYNRDYNNPMADMDAMKARGFIRVLTRNDAFSCYIKNGALVGFEYELVKRFATQNNLEVVLVIPPKFSDMTKWLEEGRGDLIAGTFTMTPERVAHYKDLTFCAPYCGVAEYVVGRPNETAKSIKDLNGRKIAIRKGNSYYDTLMKLQKEHNIKFEIIQLPENLQTPKIVTLIAQGKYDLTVADDAFVNLMVNAGCKVKKLFPISEKRPYSWVVRKNNPKLDQAVKKYFQKENKSAFFNLTYKKYFSVSNLKTVAPIMTRKNVRLSPYDQIFQKYGLKYKFDWYLLAAQSYQESQFDVNATSGVGALGLMQVMPKTARDLGFDEVITPDNGIHAGVRYLSILRDRFEPTLTEKDRICFALASYNAGYGHVQDARKLALELGLNPNIWSGHVEVAMELLADPEIASQTKYGYCRSFETIHYIRNILEHANAYERIVRTLQEIDKTQLPKNK